MKGENRKKIRKIMHDERKKELLHEVLTKKNNGHTLFSKEKTSTIETEMSNRRAYQVINNRNLFERKNFRKL